MGERTGMLELDLDEIIKVSRYFDEYEELVEQYDLNKLRI